MKALCLFLVRLLFRFRAFNTTVLSTPGPVLLIPNHVSWLDWLFLGVCLEDDWRFVTSSVTAQTSWVHRFIMVNRRTFPIDTNSPYAVKRMAEYLQSGGRLVLFAEGRLSRTGTLMKLFEGTGFLLFKTRAKVITSYLRGAHRLPCSPHPGWRRWFPPITAHFSEVLEPPHLEQVSTAKARAHLTAWLRDQMVRLQFRVECEFGPRDLLAAISETAATQAGKVVLQDVTANSLTYRRLLAGADLLRRQFTSRLPAAAVRVGVLLPNLNVTPVVLLGLWAAGRVPAVLNFTTGTATMLTCAQLAGLKVVVTSRAFLERAKLNPSAFAAAGVEFVFLEDLRAGISSWKRMAALLRQVVAAGLRPAAPLPETAVVLFTSGSEGLPKGVELTHANILANLRQMISVADITDRDRFFNALPLFHCFGLNVGLLLPLVRGLFSFLYLSPLHYRVVPTLFYDRDCTVLISTNTFLNGYARKAHPYDFRSLRYLFAAAEKLQEATAQVWSNRYGVRILEGYGATECSPCLSLNTLVEPRPGSVGRLLPGIQLRLEPVEGVAEGGRLLVRGPNIMRGYLNPDANEKFRALGGWYDTGDIVRVDADGYLYILGRLKRFAKISGEMVSLTAVEDALAGAFPHYGLRCQVAVLTRPDADRGEALIALTNEARLTLDEIRASLRARGLPNLWVPRELKFIREIPKLGTGKVNHRELAKLV